MMKLHPNLDYLSEYASGGLSPGQNAAVSAHLHFCSVCRDHVSSLEEIGGLMLERIAAEAVSEELLEMVLAGIDARTSEAKAPGSEVEVADEDVQQLPSLVRKLLPHGKANWRSLSSSLDVALIPVGERRFELALHKIQPGGRTPQHDHRGLEITVVLQGSFSDDDGIYAEGDFIVREPGDVHAPMASQNEQCICLSVCEAPIRLTGPIMRLMNPFFRFRPS